MGYTFPRCSGGANKNINYYDVLFFHASDSKWFKIVNTIDKIVSSIKFLDIVAGYDGDTGGIIVICV